MELKDSFKRQYKMRSIGTNGLSTIITLPPVVVEREASKRGLTVAEFIEQYRVVAHFDNFDGVFYSFEKPVLKEPRTPKRETETKFDELRRIMRRE